MPKKRRSYSLCKLMILGYLTPCSRRKWNISSHIRVGTMSVIDYILIRRNNIGQVKDYKVIPGESIATQHIILTMDICIQTKKRVKPRRRKHQTKWWRLKDQDENRKFASQVEENIDDIKNQLLLDTEIRKRRLQREISMVVE